MNLDEELRAALRRQAPQEDLAPRVLARLRAPQGPRPRHTWRLALVAVVVAIAAGLGLFRQQQQEQQRARMAAEQIAAALHLASNELATVRAKVVRTP